MYYNKTVNRCFIILIGKVGVPEITAEGCNAHLVFPIGN